MMDALKEWNPWWQNPRELRGLEGKPRPLYEEAISSIRLREVIALTGVRRAGKSTLMYQMVERLLGEGVRPEQVLFANLEDPRLTSSLQEIYAGYRSALNPAGKAYIFLDEIHQADGWERWLRTKYDQKSADKFVVSGSSSHLLREEYATLLTGRNLTFEVFPLSFREAAHFAGIEAIGIVLDETKYRILKQLDEYFQHGGFPESLLAGGRPRLLAQYFDDILYKDIIARNGLNAQKARDLALYLAANIGRPISLRTIRGTLGLSYDATREYLSRYRDAFLFLTVDHFSYSFKEQKTMPSKAYCIDPGLRNAVAFSGSKDTGWLAENVVAVELRRRGEQPYYWTGEGEVDFVVKRPDQSLSAMNVSYTDDIPEREVVSLIAFRERFPRTSETILLTRDTTGEERGVRLLPLWRWLLSAQGTS